MQTWSCKGGQNNIPLWPQEKPQSQSAGQVHTHRINLHLVAAETLKDPAS